MTWQTVSHSPATTELLGSKLGGRLKGGEVVELVSDVGGGKTTFVRGMAHGIGTSDVVASPTFTISREYRADKFTLYHFDFYRLPEPGIVAAELAEVVHDPQAVVVVEWGEMVEDVLPAQRLIVTFISPSPSDRELTFTYPQQLTYLIPAGD